MALWAEDNPEAKQSLERALTAAQLQLVMLRNAKRRGDKKKFAELLKVDIEVTTRNHQITARNRGLLLRTNKETIIITTTMTMTMTMKMTFGAHKERPKRLMT